MSFIHNLRYKSEYYQNKNLVDIGFLCLKRNETTNKPL
ncbi:hypothetical protein CU019_0698 [Enterococcus faecium]|nr:hypothetical protein [Enterococcus faecium]MBK4791145.1 hypothetical protein [Enterococcus faecium]MBK4797899.1 hypothetical protein [Enterococcus faecium]MBK4819201.1 hypothetical protein [Enterococcus faecium]